MNSGILIGIIFSVSLGVLGSAIGTYFSPAKPYTWLLWIPYGIALPPTIIRWNKRQMEIRNEERLSQG